MPRSRLAALALTLATALGARAAAGQPVLTDVTLFNATIFGVQAGTAWNTRGGDLVPNAFLSPDPAPTFVAANVLNPAGGLSVPLAVGTHTFYAYASGSFSNDFGLNLFFDGATTPGISALASFGTGFDPNTTAGCTPTPTVGCTPAAGTLVHTAGGYAVTLHWLLLADAAENGGSVDRVGELAVGGDGTFDNHSRIRLVVTAVPEPSSLALLAAGALGVWVAARRRAGRAG